MYVVLVRESSSCVVIGGVTGSCYGEMIIRTMGFMDSFPGFLECVAVRVYVYICVYIYVSVCVC